MFNRKKQLEAENLENFDLALTEESRKKAIANLNRAIGQIKSVIKDLEEDHACEESITQLQAARGAINSQIGKLIDDGILSCLTNYPSDKVNLIIKKILKMQS